MTYEWTESGTELTVAKTDKNSDILVTPPHVDTVIIIHLTNTNLLKHISHNAAKPLGRKLLQLCTLMTVNHVV